ncbi:MerR family transcriptional regulator [Micromonospora sediminicola]|uniref:MerR family transcriptional regulator n=1 Tax=Micromonospora sediminicola TaxID=946078 RepID=UPI0033B30650
MVGRHPRVRDRLRPVDLARAYGVSTQAVRNYEAAGVLPEATRTGHGYRTYTPRHAAALRAFLALVAGHGHRAATAIMRAVHRGAVDEALRLVDTGHARLLDDRRSLDAVAAALADLPAGTGEDVASGRGAVFVGALARRLGVRPATLRQWERAGLLCPGRDPRTGYRVYRPADVRDALLVGQLRRGGYPLARIVPLLVEVRAAGGVADLDAVLGDWRARLGARGRALLTGAAALAAYLDADGS